MNKRELIILSLGSDLGNREANLVRALEEIALVFQSRLSISSFYTSSPWGFDSETLFLNCCASFYSDQSPLIILRNLQEIEKKMGRTEKSKDGKYASRLIDLDLLYIGNQIFEHKELMVPHPLLYSRNFVLKPLSEIHSNFIDPLKKKTVKELFSECIDKNTVYFFKK